MNKQWYPQNCPNNNENMCYLPFRIVNVSNKLLSTIIHGKYSAGLTWWWNKRGWTNLCVQCTCIWLKGLWGLGQLSPGRLWPQRSSSVKVRSVAFCPTGPKYPIIGKGREHRLSDTEASNRLSQASPMASLGPLEAQFVCPQPRTGLSGSCGLYLLCQIRLLSIVVATGRAASCICSPVTRHVLFLVIPTSSLPACFKLLILFSVTKFRPKKRDQIVMSCSTEKSFTKI